MSYAEQKYSNNSTIGTSNYKPLDQIVNQDKESIEALINQWFQRGFVKSVQRGIVATDRYGDDTTATLTSININKSIVLLNGQGITVNTVSGGISSDSDVYAGVGVYVKELTSTKLTIGFPSLVNYSGTVISWQVIEFY